MLKMMKIPDDIYDKLVDMKERPEDAAWRSIVNLLKENDKLLKELLEYR